MMNVLSKRIWAVLSCPHCGGSLLKIDDGAKCSGCNEVYPYLPGGQLDLRLRKKKIYRLQMELGGDFLPEKGFAFEALQRNVSPSVDFGGLKIPWYLGKELVSYFPRAKEADSLMLDLGCGNTIYREICERAGFEYVSLDYSSPNALLLGDAHALPFKDNSFEFILSVAVLEHVRYPFVMAGEAYRVLKPAGKFIGTVAFLEPFHLNSFYHHTHLGVFNSIQTGGFRIEHIAPSVNWPALLAQANMGLFPKSPRLISKILAFPLYMLHRLWWRFGYLITRSEKATEKCRVLNNSGAFFFIASKNKN